MSEANPKCPIYGLLKLLSAKWTIEILRELSIKPTRTTEFLRSTPGLKMKCLQERLRALQAAGLIARDVSPNKVPSGTYHVTARGLRMIEVLLAIREIAAETMDYSCVCPLEIQTEHHGSLSNIEFDCPTRVERCS